jgi:heme oxygenase
MTVSATSSQDKPLLEACPVLAEAASSKECPFKQHSTAASTGAAACPAFDGGCPFRDVRSISELIEVFKTVPHLTPGQLGSAAAERGAKELVALLRGMHATGERLQQQTGESCPVFAAGEGCPFKQTVPPSLVESMDRCHWSSALAAAEPEPEPPFSQQIKEGTSASHKAAEEVHFVKSFIAGEIDLQLYKQLLADLWHVYRTMEARLDAEAVAGSDSGIVERIHFPVELSRTQTLEADLEHWLGAEWRSSPLLLAQTPCTREYVQRLESCSPQELVAHAYTRYMGDLSGGQVLMRRARKAFGLPAGSTAGLDFYVFEQIPKAKAFKDSYRGVLDSLNVDSVVAEEIIAEANIAFLMNMRLFAELDAMGGASAAPPPPLPAAVSSLLAQQASDRRQNKPPSACPFANLGKALGIANPHGDEPSDLADVADVSIGATGGGAAAAVSLAGGAAGQRWYLTTAVLIAAACACVCAVIFASAQQQ